MLALLRSRNHRAGLLILAALVSVSMLISYRATSAWAQQSDLTEAQTPAATPPAAGTPTDTSGAAAPAAATTTSGTDQSLLEFFFKALGWRYTIIFLALSFVFVALAVMCVLAMRRDAVIPAALIEGFEGHLNEKRYQEAYELAKADDSMLGRILSAGLSKLSAGYPQAIESMQEVSEDETMKMEHRISYVALIGTLAPMFGLLGTVDGMVQSFQKIATSENTPKASELAEGISMALVTTLVGLWLAIPAIALFGFLRNKMARLVLECGILSEGLMSRFGKKA